MSASRFSPFVSPLVRRKLAEPDALPLVPSERGFPGVVLLADVTGFTALTESLAAGGPTGAEAVKDVLNASFGPLIELVAMHGGDVVQFAGDAVLALFAPTSDGDLADAVARAEAAAAAIQQQVGSVATPGGAPLRLRIGIGTGMVRHVIAGGVGDRWFSLVAGQALTEAVAGVQRAAAGETITAAGAQRWRQDGPEATPAHDPPGPLPAQAEEALRVFVPRALQIRLDAGQTEWLAEFRRLSVLFVCVRGGPPATLDELHRLAQVMQSEVYRHQGAVNQFLIDDKGTTLLAAWGVPSHTHEDDPVRAVNAAMAIREALMRAGIVCGIGIATGRVFTGVRGNTRRCEFGLIGDTVNLAARLMDVGDGRIRCDQATRAGARRHVIFEALAPLGIKGRTGATVAYHAVRAKPRLERGERELIGRSRERQVLSAALRDVENGRSGVVVLEGEAGIGKSRLIAELLDRARVSTVRPIVAAGDALERSAPLHAWRRVFAGLLGGSDAASAARARLLSLLEPDRDLVASASLVNTVVPIDVPATLDTAALSADGRAARTRDVLTHLFRRVATTGAVLVLEDAHWFDSESWALAEALWRSAPPLAIVIVTRPLVAGELPPEGQRLVDAAAERRLKLQALDGEDIVALVSLHLDVDLLPEAVARFVRERAEGHPFFALELANTLRERGFIRVEQGECLLAVGESDLMALGVGATIESVVTGRIDRLSAHEQLTLKVASIFGRLFDVAVLTDIHPIDADRLDVPEQLTRMTQLELLAESDEPGLYRFTHAIIQQVAYDLLPFAERRQLHRAAAEWLERTPAETLDGSLALLAHHWSCAENEPKALEYLERAGEQALERDNNTEAVRFFGEALAIGKKLEGTEAAVRRGRWHMQLGVAHFLLRQTDQATAELATSLELLGTKLPRSAAGRAWFAAREGVRQTRTLALGRPAGGRSAERLAIASVAAGQLAWVNMVRRDGPGVAMMSLLAVNLADRANTASIVGLGFLGAMASAMGWRTLGRRYFDRAEAESRGMTRDRLLEMLFDAMDQLGAGDVPGSLETLREATDAARRSGARPMLAAHLSLRGAVETMAGRFAEGAELARQAASLSKDGLSHDRYHVLNIHTLCEGYRRPGAEGLALFREREPELLDSLEPGDAQARASFVATKAVLSFRGGEWTAAEMANDEACGLFIKGFRTTPPAYHATVQGGSEVYVGLWDHIRERGGDERPIRAKALRAKRLLERFARHHPVYRARLLIVRGQIAWLDGKPDEARRCWTEGAALAGRLQLRFDEALAYFEMGRRAALGTADRGKYLALARTMFAAGGARHELESAKSLAS